MIGFGVALDADAWRKIPPELIRRDGNAQQFCFMRIMRMITDRMMLSAPDDFISLHFDYDQQFTASRFQRYMGILEADPNARRYFASFAIADPKRYTPLQAADLLAWETRKEMMRKLGGHDSRPEFNFLFEVFPGYYPAYASEFWDETEIQEKIVRPFIGQQEVGKSG